MHYDSPMERFRRMFWPGHGRLKGDYVTVGDRFEEKGDYPAHWVVENICHVAGSDFPLVRLRREGAPDLTRTLSLSALEEIEVYVKMAPEKEVAVHH